MNNFYAIGWHHIVSSGTLFASSNYSSSSDNINGFTYYLINTAVNSALDRYGRNVGSGDSGNTETLQMVCGPQPIAVFSSHSPDDENLLSKNNNPNNPFSYRKHQTNL